MFNDIFIDNVRRLEIHMVSPLHKKEQEAFKKAVAKELAQTKEFKLHGFFKIPELKDAQVYFKDFMSLQ